MINLIELPSTLNSFSLEDVYTGASLTEDDGLIISARKLKDFSFGGICGLVALARLYAGRVTFELPEYADVSQRLDRYGFFRVTENFLILNGTFPPSLELYTLDPRFTPLHSIGFPGRSGDSNEWTARAILNAMVSVRSVSREGPDKMYEYLTTALASVAERCKLVPAEFVGKDEIGWVTAGITYDKAGNENFSIAIVDLAETALQTVGGVEGVAGSAADLAALERLTFPPEFKFRLNPYGYGGLKRIAGLESGLMSIRSGRACIRLVPEWSNLPPMATDLAYFPGIQIGMTLRQSS